MLPILQINAEPLIKQPPISVLPSDMVKLLFMKITTDKDLCSFTLACTSLFHISQSPMIQKRIHRYKIACHFDKQLDEKSTQLILALDKRPLSLAEAATAGIPFGYSNRALSQLEAEYVLSAEKSEREFCALFERRCAELNINPHSEEFAIDTKTIFEALKEKAILMKLYGGNMVIKSKTVATNFFAKIFYSCVYDYAKQPLAMITPNNFKQKVAQLKKLIPKCDIVNIELCLRKAIRTQENIPLLTRLAADYSGAASPVIEELKQALKIELEASKTESDITDKKLREIEIKLGSLDETAKLEAQKLGLFFKQLNRPVLPGYAAIQSAALHKIID